VGRFTMPRRRKASAPCESSISSSVSPLPSGRKGQSRVQKIPALQKGDQRGGTDCLSLDLSGNPCGSQYARIDLHDNVGHMRLSPHCFAVPGLAYLPPCSLSAATNHSYACAVVPRKPDPRVEHREAFSTMSVATAIYVRGRTVDGNRDEKCVTSGRRGPAARGQHHHHGAQIQRASDQQRRP
jgi:hypothetical protein